MSLNVDSVTKYAVIAAGVLMMWPGPSSAQSRYIDSGEADAPTAPSISGSGCAKVSEGDEQPWERGVSLDERKRACELFARGTEKLLLDAAFSEAAELFKQALKHWNHPRIHFNLASALRDLNQPIERYMTLQRAVRYGAVALGQDKYELAQKQMKILEQKLSFIEIACEVPGARVTLDGKYLFTGPGRINQIVVAGDHAIAATKPGYTEDGETRDFEPGQSPTITLRLYPLTELTEKYHKLGNPNIQWWLLAGGAVAAMTGGSFIAVARIDQNEFNAQVKRCGSEGCQVGEVDESLRLRAREQNMAGVITLGIGAAALTGGLIVAIYNRERERRLSVEDIESRGVAVIPLISHQTLGFHASFSF